MTLDAERSVPYWPHYLPGPGAAIPSQLTPQAEMVLAAPEPEPEPEAEI